MSIMLLCDNVPISSNEHELCKYGVLQYRIMYLLSGTLACRNHQLFINPFQYCIKDFVFIHHIFDTSIVKKVFAAILALLYFTATTGATVHLHFCMGKLVEETLWHNEAEQCSKCGMEKNQQKNDCCKDEHKQIKLQNDHYLAVSNFSVFDITSLALPVAFIEIPSPAITSISEGNPRSNAPPRSWDIPIYKRNCVFRI